MTDDVKKDNGQTEEPQPQTLNQEDERVLIYLQLRSKRRIAAMTVEHLKAMRNVLRACVGAIVSQIPVCDMRESVLNSLETRAKQLAAEAEKAEWQGLDKVTLELMEEVRDTMLAGKDAVTPEGE